jgi:periplasmic protein TonB
MSYADHRRPRGPALAAAIIIQGTIGYALIAGLAYTIVPRRFDPPLTTTDVHLPPPPPLKPEPKPVPRETHLQPTDPLPFQSHPAVETPHETPIETSTVPTPTWTPPTTVEVGPPTPPQPPQPLAIDQSAGPSPIGDQGGWFPQDAYPGGALSRGAEGRVSVSVAIGTDGRVNDCQVVATSGDRDLDAATCRLAKRNGRFKPALDRDGHPIASSTTLRNVRWEINGG